MIVSKRNGKIDAEIFLQHLREGPDGDKDLMEVEINNLLCRMLGVYDCLDPQDIYNIVTYQQ